jgi:hypothetical protein
LKGTGFSPYIQAENDLGFSPRGSLKGQFTVLQRLKQGFLLLPMDGLKPVPFNWRPRDDIQPRCLPEVSALASLEPFRRLQSKEMSDTLYLSLWYPNLRLAALPDKLNAVLAEFAAHGGEPRVYAATVWPISWTESPVFQRVYGWRERGAEPRLAVEEALELLHDDYAYEFQIGWSLWELEAGGNLDARWVREPRLVRVTGYGPLFDVGAFEADGHIRIDFGTDAPFLEEELELDSIAARHVEENVRQLVELTAAVEKASGATARLLWSELGESLAQRLAARLGVAN